MTTTSHTNCHGQDVSKVYAPPTPVQKQLQQLVV